MEVLHERCAGLDVHKKTVVACVRLARDGGVEKEVRTFKTTTADLLALGEWLDGHDVTHVVMEATGVYWKPVWHILDDGERELVLANAAHVKNVPGRKSDVSDCDWLSDLEAHGLIRASFVPDRPDPGAARPAAHAQAAGARAVQPHAAPAEDAGGGQHQARLGDQQRRSGVSGRRMIEAMIGGRERSGGAGRPWPTGGSRPRRRCCAKPCVAG